MVAVFALGAIQLAGSPSHATAARRPPEFTETSVFQTARIPAMARTISGPDTFAMTAACISSGS
jgi:hypothetical protein